MGRPFQPSSSGQASRGAAAAPAQGGRQPEHGQGNGERWDGGTDRSSLSAGIPVNPGLNDGDAALLPRPPAAPLAVERELIRVQKSHVVLVLLQRPQRARTCARASRSASLPTAGERSRPSAAVPRRASRWPEAPRAAATHRRVSVPDRLTPGPGTV